MRAEAFRGTATREVRKQIAASLARCQATERLMLALLLYERMNAREAARTLGMPVTQVCQIYRGLLADLQRAVRGSECEATARSDRRSRNGRASRAV